MTDRINRLTARSVAAITKPGRHSDSQNLYFKVTKTATGLSRHWVFFYRRHGKQREIGLGSATKVSLAQAREKAAECRALLAKGVDPLDAKKAAGRPLITQQTFGQCAIDFLASHRRGWRSAKHTGQWMTPIDAYCGPILGKPVNEIDVNAVLSVLNPIWNRIPETASRLRGRIEAVLDYAKAHKFRSGENPAMWRGNLALILPKRQALSRSHFAAMAYQDVPEFIGKLRELESMPAMALEFLILTSARTGEVLGARWGEIDFETKVWSLAAARMKSGKEHRVPLSGRAIEILERLAAIRSDESVFPGQRRGHPLSPSVMKRALARMKIEGATVHGFRSSFRDWAGNETAFPREIAEAALAHCVGNSVEAAYRRGDALEKRRGLIQCWSDYCERKSDSKVVSFTRPAS